MKKLFERIKNIPAGELVSYLVGIIGIGSTVISLIMTEQNGFATAFIVSIIMQVMLTVALGWCVYEKWNHKKEIGGIQEKQNEIQKQLMKEKVNAENERDRAKDKVNECLSRIGTIASQVKNISKLNNDFSTRIPELTERTYHLLEILQIGNITDKKTVSDEMLNALDQYASGLFELFKRYTANLLGYIITLEEACLALRGHSHKVTSTVKLFHTPLDFTHVQKEDIIVYTAFRDKETYDEGKREVGVETYSIEKNADFVQCLQKDHFIINNATKDSNSYWNEHEDFDRYYNCTIVVPIKTKQPDGKFVYYGYLCCDCLNKDNPMFEVFDKQCAQFLYAAAQSYAIFLETLDSNWRDRVQEIDGQPDNFIKIIYSRTYRGRQQQAA